MYTKADMAKAWNEGFAAGSYNENVVQYAVRENTPMPRVQVNPYEGRRIICDFGEACPGHADPLDRPCEWAPPKERNP